MMNTLPDTYKLDQNLGWEDFEVNEYSMIHMSS